MIGVQGIGWIDEHSYGCVRHKSRTAYAGRESFRKLGKTDSLFNYPVKNFGRFETITQRVCYTTALALRDSGIDYAEGVKQDIGLLGTSPVGCVESNFNYFKDYVDGGRTLSRANLFIYTLPSSPFAEAAVHFGLLGPMLYGNDFAELVNMARGMIQHKEAPIMLLSSVDERTGVCFCLSEAEDTLCSVEQLAGAGTAGDLLGKVKALNES